jgi:predicted ATPase
VRLLGSRYEVLEAVSNRGTHQVLKAIDRELDLLVALKAYSTQGNVDREQVLSEAHMLVSVPPHAGLPLARFSFFEDERFFLVMDWVDGKDLGRLLRECGQPGLTIPNVVDVVSKVADALDLLHRRSPPIIHGDVKPSNLIQTRDGDVVLVDFGVAVLGGRHGFAGSRGYIAPEVAAAIPLTPAADVYGLAASAVTLLTGLAPDAKPSIFETIESAEIAEFSQCLRAALTTDPARRTRSAGELAQRMREAASGAIPSGVATMLSAEIADAPSLWEASPDLMPDVRERVRDMVAETVQENGGRLLSALGDADTMWAVFRDPSAAVIAAQAVQGRVSGGPWPRQLPVALRVAIDTGAVDLRDGRYQGRILNRVARLRSITPRARVLVSEATAAVSSDTLPSGTTLRSLGSREVRGVAGRVALFAVVDGDTEPFDPDGDGRPPGNVQSPFTRFIGRRRELDDLSHLVDTNRLCAVTGAIGVGKSRLAIEVSQRMSPHFPDGVWLIDVGQLSTLDQLIEAVVNALDLTEAGAGTYAVPSRVQFRSMEERVIESLVHRRALLVFDNHDQAMGACAALAGTLLRACRDVRVVTTGHQPLGLEAEAVYHVSPLDIPAEGATSEHVKTSEAVELFVDRAELHDPHVCKDETALQVVAAICRRLEGIPLSIELAASWTSVLSVAQIQALRIEPHRADVQSAIDTLEWSYEQLSEPQRAVLRRLSVFAGSFGLDAAAAVCGSSPLTPPDLPEVLASLADKSLLEIQTSSSEKRYRLLNATRQLAEARLVASGEEASVKAAHIAYHLVVARGAGDHPVEQEWLDVIERDRDDFRRAYETAQSVGNGDDLRLAGALTPFWLIRGHTADGRAWLADALNANAGGSSVAPTARGEAVWSAALLACFAGDVQGAAVAARDSLAIAERCTARSLDARAEAVLAMVAQGQGRQAEAERRGRDALAAARDLDDVRLAAFVLANLGNVLLGRGAVDEARARYEESLAVRRAAKDMYGLTWTLFRLGLLTAWEGHLDRAREMLDEARRHAEVLSYPQGRLLALLGLGEVEHLSDQPVKATEWLLEAVVLARSLGENATEAITLAALAEVAIEAGDRARASSWLVDTDDCRVDENLPALASVARSRGLLAAAGDDYVTAAHHHRAALLLRHRLHDLRAMVDELELLALSLDHVGDTSLALTLLSCAASARQQMGLPLPRIREASVGALRRALASTATATTVLTMVEASELTLDRVVAAALQSAARS